LEDSLNFLHCALSAQSERSRRSYWNTVLLEDSFNGVMEIRKLTT